MILVTGATGNAGGATLRALVAAGEPVRGLVRDASRAGRLPAGAEAAVGDLGAPETLGEALQGVRAVFLLSGYPRMRETLEAIRAAGAERVVLLSSSSAPSGDESNAVTAYHVRSERAVRASGLQWTFLQPNSFMTNTFQWLPQLRAGDTIRSAFPDVAVAAIHPDDLGAVAAAALTRDGHAGRAHRLSGPEALTPAQRVAVLARVLGRPLRFEAQSDEEAQEEMAATMPPEYVDAFLRFFAQGELDESAVLPAVEAITGRPPRSYEAWVREHAAALR